MDNFIEDFTDIELLKEVKKMYNSFDVDVLVVNGVKSSMIQMCSTIASLSIINDIPRRELFISVKNTIIFSQLEDEESQKADDWFKAI